VQDAAHGSLLRSSRQQLHARIIEALEASSPELMDSNPASFGSESKGPDLCPSDRYGSAGIGLVRFSLFTLALFTGVFRARLRPAALTVPHFPRFRALALFSCRPPEHIEASSLSASENLHKVQRTKRYPRLASVQAPLAVNLAMPRDCAERPLAIIRVRHSVTQTGSEKSVADRC
jgi:hypothetical protein